MRLGVLLAAAIVACAAPTASAQAPGPGVVTTGSPDVVMGGAPAARAGDMDSSGAPIAAGSTGVFINGRPAAASGSRTGCGGVVISGSSNVFIGGAAAARAGDKTAGCPQK